jgi:3-oxoacyl-[acyl-carrier protein] reductase
MRDMQNLSVLITGGGSGIGEGTARRFAAAGARVTISGRTAAKIEAVASALGPNVRPVVADVTRDEDRRRLVAAAVEHGNGLHGLVNNAGDMLRGPITDLDEEAVVGIFRNNVVSGMMLTGLCVPHLAKEGGAVVFVGSVHTRRSYPGASPYAATKGAVEVLARVLAAELGPQGIRVNCVIPGAVPTEINIRAGLFTAAEHDARMKAIASDHALKRVGSPEEIAEAIDYLVRAPWTTGASLVVDGGLALGLSNY